MSRSPDMANLRAELLQWVSDHCAHLLGEYGIDSELAEQAGCALADDLAEEWGGQVLSIPKDHFYVMARRDQELLEAHRAGESLASIAMRMRITVRAVRKIVKRADLRDPNHRQPPLF